MKLFPFLFPCSNDALREICPFGDLVVGNVALANVQKNLAKVTILDYIDRLYCPMSDMRKLRMSKDKLGHHQ